MSEFRHILNGQTIEEPTDWASFQGSIVRDYRTRTISEQYPATAKFSGQGYAILRALWLDNTCTMVDYQVDERCGGQWRTAVRARIIIADLVFTLPRCEVTASLVDDGIGARIANNRRIPIRYTTERTKNAQDMPAVPEVDVEMFTPSTGVYLAQTRRMLDWKEAMTHAVRFITDDNVQVASNWYDTLPDDERFALTTGIQIRAAGTGLRALYMEYSFEELFDPLAKGYDLWLFVTRDINGDPVVNIETDAATASTQVAITHTAVEALEQEVDSDQLYASVAVGSESGLPNLDAVQSLPFLILIGQSLERFPLSGVCNTEAELDLVVRWNICTNLIERTLNGNTEEDDNIFLIQYDRATLQATQGTDYTPAFQYNPELLNFRVLSRHNLPSTIAVETADPANLVGAIEQVLNSPVPVGNISAPPTGVFQLFITPSSVANFSNVISDPGGNFQLSPGRYTAPVQGFYSFTLAYRFSLAFQQVQSFLLNPRIEWRRFDSTDTLLSTALITSLSPILSFGPFGPVPLTGGSAGPFDALSIFSTVLDPGDYITVRFAWNIASGPGATVTQIVLPSLFSRWLHPRIHCRSARRRHHRHEQRPCPRHQVHMEPPHTRRPMG
jgi:hypothetical protein